MMIKAFVLVFFFGVINNNAEARWYQMGMACKGPSQTTSNAYFNHWCPDIITNGNATTNDIAKRNEKIVKIETIKTPQLKTK